MLSITLKGPMLQHRQLCVYICRVVDRDLATINIMCLKRRWWNPVNRSSLLEGLYQSSLAIVIARDWVGTIHHTDHCTLQMFCQYSNRTNYVSTWYIYSTYHCLADLTLHIASAIIPGAVCIIHTTVVSPSYASSSGSLTFLTPLQPLLPNCQTRQYTVWQT